MAEHPPFYYEECYECKFAEFKDYESMECTLSVGCIPNSNCEKFEVIGGNSKERVNILGATNELIDLSHNKAVEKQKQEKIIEERVELIKNIESKKTNEQKTRIISKIEQIENKNDYDSSRKLDPRLLTLSEVNIYNSTEIRAHRKIRTEPPHKLIPFKREIIRDGFNLIMLKEANGQKAYIWKERNKVQVCDQCVVKTKPLDIILMPHDQFDAYAETQKPQIKEIKKGHADDIESFVQARYGTTVVSIKDLVKKGDKTIPYVNIIGFSSELRNIKIGRLSPNSKFYITHSKGDKAARKIMTENGTEAILISNAETYNEIVPPLQSFINGIIILLTLTIYLGGTITLLNETGWLITGGLIALVIGYLVSTFVGAPIYYLLNQVKKRM